MHDHRLVRYMSILVLLPLALAYCSGDRFRYPCQDPANWEKDICKLPLCDVTRTCPELIFKGHDPKTGLNTDGSTLPRTIPAPTGAICK